ncbi:MAG TPA: hypothetical protein PLS90_16145, partial [Candidatus Sumerlaeota bacterium]|nr:hypothetical protein [Candidatus Sumerlaeota bacterium]
MIFIPHARSLAEPLRRVALPLLLLSIYQLILIEFVNPHMAIVWWQLPLLPLLALLARRRRIAPPVAIAYGLIQLYLLSEPAVGWGVVIWFYLPGLLWLVHACPRPRALLGYGLWTGWMIAMGIYAWLWRAMASFWEIPLLHALPIFALVVVLIGFQMALIFPLVRLAGGRLPFIPIAVGAVIIHAAVEFWMPLPFPIDVALAFSNLPLLLQPADRVGLHGVGLIVLAAGAALAAAVIHARRRRWRRSVLALAALALILSLHLGYGLWAWRRYAPRPSPLSINVALIQPVAPLKIHNADHAAKDRIAR